MTIATTVLHADRALLPQGWAADVEITVGADGHIAGVQAGAARAAAAERVALLLPGVPNVHGHAFQRAMAGRTEFAGPDTFWSWRERMYELAAAMTPERLGAIATALYVEMLKAGYTAAVEFHYLHHAARTGETLAMSEALLDAAEAAGIRLTFIPALYLHGGFGGAAPTPRQRRFTLAPADCLALGDELRARESATVRTGFAVHSLRAVDPGGLAEVLAHRAHAAPESPMHLHVAEQEAEVEQCVAWSGRRPVEWLLEHHRPDAHWCLVHATHVTPRECEDLAGTGATVALCPTTEANLGDGVFPLADFLGAGGHVAIGSDSHVSVSPVEELRWLEYAQRLVHRRRNVAASAAEPHTGARLVRAALSGGARALGQPAGAIAPGRCADFLALDAHHPLLEGGDGDELLDRWVFAGTPELVRHVMVGGRWVVRDGSHEWDG